MTDMDKLTAAFKDLQVRRLATRMNYWCCSGCSGNALTQAVDAENTGRADGDKLIGGVWFHEQDAESAIDGHGLRLRYSSYPEQSDELTEQIGRDVVATLNRHDLATKWSGSAAQAITIPVFSVTLDEMPKGEGSSLHEQYDDEDDEEE